MFSLLNLRRKQQVVKSIKLNIFPAAERKLDTECGVKDQGPFLKCHILQNSTSVCTYAERENLSMDTFTGLQLATQLENWRYFKGRAASFVYIQN